MPSLTLRKSESQDTKCALASRAMQCKENIHVNDWQPCTAFSGLKPTIHDAPCNMQLAACNRIALCVLEMLRVACSVKLFQANRIVVYSLQHVARSFKGFTGNAATEYLSRHGDYSEMQRFYGLASVGTKMAAFLWMVAKIDVLQVWRRKSCRYGEQCTIFILVRRITSLRLATPARHACPPVPCFPCTSDRSTRVQYIRML